MIAVASNDRTPPRRESEPLRASYEATLDVLQRLVEAYPELGHSLATVPQQIALWEANAHLAAAGRRVRR